MPRNTDWRERRFGKRSETMISRNMLLHYVDIILDCVDVHAAPDLYNRCVLIMGHLVETELAHWGDN